MNLSQLFRSTASASLLLLSAAALHAQPAPRIEAAPRSEPVHHEARFGYSFTGSHNIDQGDDRIGNIGSQNASFNYVASIPVAEDWRARLGFIWDAHYFSLPESVPLPNTLQTTALVAGFDWSINDQWGMRLELRPGIYSDFEDISFDDFNLPGYLIGMWSPNENLTWIFGAAFDPRYGVFFGGDNVPVFPVVGVRWTFAEDWTLNLVMPKPRIEYRVTEQLTLHAGAEWRGGGYRVREDMGDSFGRADLNNARLRYREIRAGAGLAWRFHPAIALEIEGGWLVSRELDYFKEKLRYDGGGAGYGSIAVSGRF